MKAILINQTGKTYRAVSGEKQSVGKTIGEAVDNLTEQMDNTQQETLFIVQRFQPDKFFTAEQQKRLSKLMKKLHQAEAENKQMNPEEKTELENLIEAELEGSANRAEAIANLMNE